MSELLQRASRDLETAKAAESRARASLDKAQAEIAELTIFVKRLQQYEGVIQEIAPAADQPNAMLRAMPAASRPRGTPREGSKSKQLLDVAIGLIHQSERAPNIAELVEAVHAAGLSVGGADEKANLAGYLSRDPRVKFHRGVGWLPAQPGEEIEAADEPGEDPAASTVNNASEGGSHVVAANMSS